MELLNQHLSLDQNEKPKKMKVKRIALPFSDRLSVQGLSGQAGGE